MKTQDLRIEAAAWRAVEAALGAEYPEDRVPVAELLSRAADDIERLQFLLWYRHMHPTTPITAEEQEHITAHLKRPASI